MKKYVSAKWVIIISACVICVPLFAFVMGCASQPQEEPDTEEPEVEEAYIDPEPQPEPEPEPQPEPEAQQEEEFVVTEEVFTQTFEDVEALIKRLNRIIGSSDFQRWLTYCTEEYIDYYSDTDTLRELSQRPTLQKYNIRLTTLEDYFNYVVVPSRSNARLDDLVFEDNNHVKAIMIIEDQRVILYQLEKVNDEWKIGI